MSRVLPTIRERLFRIHLSVTLTAVVVLSIGTSIADWETTRRLLINDFENSLNVAAGGTARFVHLKDTKNLEIHLNDFHALPGINALCVYDVQNKPILLWNAPDAEKGCPNFIMHEGVEAHWLYVASAKKLMYHGTYVGMFFADSRIVLWRQVLLRNGLIFLVVVTVASFATAFSTRVGARAITASLKGLQEQIECLRSNDVSVCAILPPMTTVETAGLATSLTAFRSHLAVDTMPRAELKQVRQWYRQLLSGLLVTLRHRLEADAPLLDTVAHYELLLRMEWGNALATPVVFDLSKLVKASLAAARAQVREHAQVHVNISLESSALQPWVGHPEIVRILLEHLLLIALKRTREGAVCLRLEVDAQAGFAQHHMLRLKLEDSGPALQRWQLRQWLDQVTDEVPVMDMAQDISWVLTGRLFHYLGGGASAQTEPAGGLTLMGWVPLLKPMSEVAMRRAVPPTVLPEDAPPVVMAVEPHEGKRAELRALLVQAGCQPFMMESHAQAIEWAPTLPFSAILLDGMLPDTRSIVVRRLRHLADEGLMPEIPLWAKVGLSPPAEQQQWLHAGVSVLVTLPVQADTLHALCQKLAAPAQGFYHAYDEQLHGDFPSNVVTRLSELHKEMAAQITRVANVLTAMARGEQPIGANDEIHAVKSAALTLGYYRLSALMSEIEHGIAMETFAAEPQHWDIIARCLQAAGFEHL